MADPGKQLGGARCTHGFKRDACVAYVSAGGRGALTAVDHHEPEVATGALDKPNHLVVGQARHPVAVNSDQPVLLPQARKLQRPRPAVAASGGDVRCRRTCM